MFFFNTANKARARYFDATIDGLHDILALPTIREQLQGYAPDLEKAVGRLCLPNIRHNIVSMPADKIDTDAVAVLPLLGKGNAASLRLNDSLFAPLPSTVHRLAREDKITVHDQNPEIHAELAKRYVRGIFDNSTSSVLEIVGKSAGITTRFQMSGSIEFMSRPVIVMNAPSRTIGAAMTILGHEASHVDYISRYESPDDSDLELRAYQVSRVIADHRDDLDTPELFVEVDEKRLALTDPAAPFTTTPMLTDYLKSRGLIPR